MKVRNGFVSNSSSSSFVVLGLSLSIKEMINQYKELAKKEQLYAYYDISDPESNDYFKITKEMAEAYIKHGGTRNHISFIQSFDQITDNRGIFNKKDLPDRFQIISIDTSIHSTGSYEGFVTNYVDMPVNVPDDVKTLLDEYESSEKM